MAGENDRLVRKMSSARTAVRFNLQTSQSVIEEPYGAERADGYKVVQSTIIQTFKYLGDVWKVDLV